MTRTRSVHFLIRALDVGGAERQLVTLAVGLHRSGYEVTVLVYYENSPLQVELDRAGVRVICLKKRGRWDLVPFGFRLLKLLRRERPRVLHGYMEDANILAVLAKLVFPQTRVVWGVRASNVDRSHYDWFERLAFKVSCSLSRFADLIIVNSVAGAEYHQQHGFPSSKTVVVFNGIDTDRFRPDSGARQKVRDEWGVADGDVLVGLVARLDPMKDHANLLRAAAMLGDAPRLRFVCVGSGSAEYRSQLVELSEELGVSDRILWVDNRADMETVYNAFDICCSTSAFGEGFSNTVGEAMACGIPCVVTDCGDSARIVGDTGVVVPIRNPEALAAGLRELVNVYTAERRTACRKRIEEHFSVRRLVERTQYELS